MAVPLGSAGVRHTSDREGAVTEDVPNGLELFDEDVGRVLAVVAHPDDLEYGASAAVARWTAEGKEVTYVLATRGEAGVDSSPPEESGPLREEEQRESAAIVGVDTVDFLGFPDGVLTAGLDLRRALTAEIRHFRPDTIVTINHRESWSPEGGSINSADHRALGRSLLDAVTDAANRWIFPDVGDGPHRAQRVLVAGSPRGRHAVDVTGYVDLAVASLAAHAFYLEGLGEHPMADPEFLRWILEDAGARAGCGAAVGVEVIRY
jgi:LmbE family N-acetylglucosaminyl deacetylase